MDWELNPPFGMGDASTLERAFYEHCRQVANPVFLDVKLSKQRILDVFAAWKEDLDRNRARDFKTTKENCEKAIIPDHIKAAAYLTYWLRREAPAIDFYQMSPVGGMYSLQEQNRAEFEIVHDKSELSEDFHELSEEELAQLRIGDLTGHDVINNRKMLFAYGNEFLSFTFGFIFAKAYEEQKLKELGTSNVIAFPSLGYVNELCYIFKFKNISPQAVYMIYRALLTNYEIVRGDAIV